GHQGSDRDRHREGWIHEDEERELVLQADLREHTRQRREQQRRRDEVGEEDRDAEPLAGAAREPRERVARGERERERDRDDRPADECGVAEPAHVRRVVEQEGPAGDGVALEREGRVREVEHAGLALEGRERHPDERDREHERERNGDAVGECALPPGDPHVTLPVLLPSFRVASTKPGKDAGSPRASSTGATEDAARRRVIAGRKPEGSAGRVTYETSTRRAKTSIPIATKASTGSRKSEMAAPSPSEPDWIPVWNAHVVSTWVELNGPPFVRM